MIRPYLTHPDPEMRTAALQGMIILGAAPAASRSQGDFWPERSDRLAGTASCFSYAYISKEENGKGEALQGKERACYFVDTLILNGLRPFIHWSFTPEERWVVIL